jgi:hypothetical protein
LDACSVNRNIYLASQLDDVGGRMLDAELQAASSCM